MTQREGAFLVLSTVLISTLLIIHFAGDIWYALPVIAIGAFVYGKLSKNVAKSEVEKLKEENERLKSEITQLKQENQNVK